jgi:hypothetical protein
MDCTSMDAGRRFGDITILGKLNQRTVAAETTIQKWLKAGPSWSASLQRVLEGSHSIGWSRLRRNSRSVEGISGARCLYLALF